MLNVVDDITTKECLRMDFTHGHCSTTALVSSLRMTGMVAHIILDGPVIGG